MAAKEQGSALTQNKILSPYFTHRLKKEEDAFSRIYVKKE